MLTKNSYIKTQPVTGYPFGRRRGFYAIVDCNSFYCSCERVFRPDLKEQPVIVLSNNDGCVISMSDEAKKLGITMTVPYFQAKPFIEKHKVETFSSNYNLYGDMSWRVMETLKTIVEEDNVEVYSVDEAFLDLKDIPHEQLYEAALQIRYTVEQWTGVAVSVGVAPTKVLSKVANRLCKKDKGVSNCVMVIDTPEKINDALCRTKVGDIWGVGHQYAEKLKRFGIDDAYQLRCMNEEWARKNLGGVTGLRLIKELKGEPVMQMEDELDEKKMIATTRMFGAPVKTIKDIKEAIATYTSRCAEKLRRQQSAASVVSIFVVPKVAPKDGERFRHGPTISAYTVLPHATSLTHELIKAAVKLVDEVYKDGSLYKKAGVTVSGLVPDESIQGNLFVPESRNNHRMLMGMIDNINFSMRDDALKFAASGTERNWKMRQELRSPRYTSRWDELCETV
ncbi:Y-family DNA polymerase [Foetidibacter luteolus]|uniref:Y-family DNA polymerase n=1 Tax=Foetidibacter luteolus TaxID=2608880 RepID=UPI00129A9222|nr:Y-family DNA polymerase [Foetidibacter luteolus]